MTTTLSNIARRLNFQAGATYLPPLIFLTDEKRLPDPREAASRLPIGSAVLLRHYRYPKRKELALSLKLICNTHGLQLIIADDIKLAIETGADGVHLPEHRLKSPTPDILRWRRTRLGFLTGAAHTPGALRAALWMGIDAALLSPVFSSASHRTDHHLGIIRFAKFCRMAPLPVYALGGINNITAKRLLGSGAAGIAAIGAIVNRIR